MFIISVTFLLYLCTQEGVQHKQANSIAAFENFIHDAYCIIIIFVYLEYNFETVFAAKLDKTNEKLCELLIGF